MNGFNFKDFDEAAAVSMVEDLLAMSEQEHGHQRREVPHNNPLLHKFYCKKSQGVLTSNFEVDKDTHTEETGPLREHHLRLGDKEDVALEVNDGWVEFQHNFTVVKSALSLLRKKEGDAQGLLDLLVEVKKTEPLMEAKHKELGGALKELNSFLSDLRKKIAESELVKEDNKRDYSEMSKELQSLAKEASAHQEGISGAIKKIKKFL